MLKNTPMRILAITFAFALVGCVDDDITPQGVDDIEENTDEFGPDVLKGDVDGPTTERPGEPTVGDAVPLCGSHNINCTPSATSTKAKTNLNPVELNQVPIR